MYRAQVDPPWDLDAWRTLARAALRAEIAPELIDWNTAGQSGLLPAPALETAPPRRAAPGVPTGFLALAGTVLCHSDPQRHALLYRILWRLVHGERHLLERATDPDMQRALRLQKAVSRDTHKMKAFVRFREIPGEANHFVAWFEPEHLIVDRVAPFFARRFAGMQWAILTPTRSVRWDGDKLEFGAGAQRSDAPVEDAREALWLTYYANIFNPARLNPTVMQSEMPRKYWQHLPEAALIPALVQSAGARVEAMAARAPQPARRRIPGSAAAMAPDPVDSAERIGNLDAVGTAIEACRGCELWRHATRAVAGEGARDARVMLVGEQPGDREDLGGRPFVGPAGQLLEQILATLGVDRSALYLTNAVKHFRFEQRGKQRLHRNPLVSHIDACNGWLRHEIALLRPARIVCLGATATRAVLGAAASRSVERGTWLRLDEGIEAMVTVHPAWVLRQPDDLTRAAAHALLMEDLASALAGSTPDAVQRG